MPPSGSRGRRLSGGSGSPYLVPACLTLAAALSAWVFSARLASCGGSLESRETQIRKALASQGRARLDDVYGFRAGGTVELHSVRFDDVSPSLEQGSATVVAMLTAEGHAVWRDQRARLSYLGRERFHMKPCAIALWCAEGDQFHRLRGVMLALFRRRDALERRDAEALTRLLSARLADRERAGREAVGASGASGKDQVLGWQIRVERDGAEVGEDLEVASSGAEGTRRERRLYRLERVGERWLFVDGV